MTVGMVEKKGELAIIEGKKKTLVTLDRLNELKVVLSEESREFAKRTSPLINDVKDTRIGGQETVNRVEVALTKLVERRRGWEEWYADTLGKVKEIYGSARGYGSST